MTGRRPGLSPGNPARRGRLWSHVIGGIGRMGHEGVVEEPGGGVVVDPRDAAESAGLRYVSDEEPGFRRRRAGRGFSYRSPDGTRVTDAAVRARLDALAVPPAYTEVWICADPLGHLQATGRDARGRKQYRYHPRFREVREGAKYEHMLAFAEALPAIRARVDADMRRRGLVREKVLAAVVHLLESTLIRVGSDDYARRNRSFGLSTLRGRHVAVEGSELRFRFTGKSGKSWDLALRDRRIARTVRSLQELPGQRLFQYLDADGARRDVTSTEVNAYLHEIAGRDVTAKDFRTFAGTVLAALALQEFEAVDGEAARKRNIRQAIERVAARLGNTPTICRKCYVHPEILECYLEDGLSLELREEIEEEIRDGLAELRPEEAAVLALLHRRLQRDASGAAKRTAA